MKPGFILNPIEEFVDDIKRLVRDNGGYCLHAEKGVKANKCPKYCKQMDSCPCGMYIPEQEEYDEQRD